MHHWWLKANFPDQHRHGLVRIWELSEFPQCGMLETAGSARLRFVLNNRDKCVDFGILCSNSPFAELAVTQLDLIVRNQAINVNLATFLIRLCSKAIVVVNN